MLNFLARSLQNGPICLQLFALIDYRLKTSNKRIGNDSPAAVIAFERFRDSITDLQGKKI